MLQILHIENVAVIERADIEFAPGLNVMTGETGAGKSIVIDSLGAVLGFRTSRDLVRTGAGSAAVTASFYGEEAEDWCRDNGIETEDGEVIVSRRIAADGKNSCRVCGTPVTVSQLRSLGEELLNIHGQNDGQKLLDERFHRQYLDSFGKLFPEIEAYREKYGGFVQTRKQCQELSMDESEKSRRVDTLRYQIDELETANIKLGEMESLETRRDLIKNSVKIIESLSGAFYALYGGERTDGALALIADADKYISNGARFTDGLDVISQRLSDLRYSAEDIAEQIRDFKDAFDVSPDELDNIESRISQLKRLSRKYGGTEEEMLAFLGKAKEELDNIEYAAERLEKLSRELEKRQNAAVQAAERLSSKRKDAAELLEKRIETELAELSMGAVAFKVQCESTLPHFDENGCDEILFLMSANAGEKPGKISKIASGGELARIMLAMKNVLAENDSVGTMVFDEVDTGVSGIAAQRVGEKLFKLAVKKQVICVTHLPQIASFADTHFEIRKEERGGRTYTMVTALDAKGREYELARLSGGENITEITLASASQQLSKSEEYKLNIKKGIDK